MPSMYHLSWYPGSCALDRVIPVVHRSSNTSALQSTWSSPALWYLTLRGDDVQITSENSYKMTSASYPSESVTSIEPDQ